MLFKSQQPLPLLLSSEAGRNVNPSQRRASHMQVARPMGDGVAYIGLPLTRYHIGLRRARKTLHKVQIALGLISGFAFLLLGGYGIVSSVESSRLLTLSYWTQTTGTWFFFVGCALLCFLYVWYRVLRQRVQQEEIAAPPFEVGAEVRPFTVWQEVLNVPRKKRVDISVYFSPEVQDILERAYLYAASVKAPEVLPIHVFHALLDHVEIRNVFIRLGVSASRLERLFAAALPTKTAPADPAIAHAVWDSLFYAYDEAVQAKQPCIGLTEILLTTVRQDTTLQEFLYDLDIDKETLANVIAWVRIREKLRYQFRTMRQMGSTRNKYGLDRAMTAVATPYLNTFSQDLTLAANYGRLEQCVARDEEIDEIFRIVEGGRQSVLLVGERGVGKMSIIHGIAQRMVAEDVPGRLADKRLVQLSVSALMAGTTTSGAQERLLRMMREIRRAGNIMLVIENLHDLMGVSDGSSEGLDVSETLAEELGRSSFLTFATTTREGFNKHIINTQVGQVFARVDVEEMNENQAIQVLESKAAFTEHKHSVFFSYKSLEKAVAYAGRFLHDQRLPASALEIMSESASAAQSQRGQHQLVLEEDVAFIISQKTGIPTTSISSDESQKLLQLETAMHERIVGQDEAVILVANALRRARAEIRSTKRPIANFLFLGPTGVGKTELAKTIADIYFGGEERMIRIDMSEYQDQSAIYRLIGQPGQKGSGILTEAVRQQPFSLVLFDEMEKADPNILNLFLQVFDDGRLTDSVGRVIDFTNTIIIATSNAATAYVQQQIAAGEAFDVIRDDLIRNQLKEYYRPEFLNRFDGIVLFRSLEREQVTEIARRMLVHLSKRIEEERGVIIRIEPAALELLADVGFDPDFGARPMRRAIQDRVENGLAELVLSGDLRRRDTIVIGEGLQLRIER